MRTDKQEALRLRLSGKSYSEVSRALKVPKSTLSGWFSNLVLSKDARERIQKRGNAKAIAALLEVGKRQTTLAQQRARVIQQNTARAIGQLTKRDLLILGVALYWAEGYKRPIVRNGRERTFHPVRLTNSDPALVEAFIRFLREICAVPLEKIKASIRMFEHQNETELLSFWQKITGLPVRNFNKSYRGISISSKGKRPFNRLPHGIIQIVVADTKLFHTIMGSLEGIKQVV